jgi:hypothetical protein
MTYTESRTDDLPQPTWPAWFNAEGVPVDLHHNLSESHQQLKVALRSVVNEILTARLHMETAYRAVEGNPDGTYPELIKALGVDELEETFRLLREELLDELRFDRAVLDYLAFCEHIGHAGTAPEARP